MSAFRLNGAAAQAGDVEVTNPPSDSISSIAWSPAADFLAVGGWDSDVRVYEIGPNGQNQGKFSYSHQAPVLSVCWNREGNKVFSGGTDNAARMLDLAGNSSTPQQVAGHDAPVKAVRWIDSPQGGFLVTGSWDKTIKYWDLRSSSPIATVQLPERCYTLDTTYPLMVVGCAERKIMLFDLNNPTAVFRTVDSPLKWQTRVVSCFGNDCYAVGSVEGRVAIQYADMKRAADNFSFRCHRQDGPSGKNESLIFPVNDLAYHPVHGTFATSGSDGTYAFWDKDARSRLKSFDPAPGPVIAGQFNRTGSLFGYAISYDWHKGHSGMTSSHPNKIMLHICKDEEVKRRVRR